MNEPLPPPPPPLPPPVGPTDAPPALSRRTKIAFGAGAALLVGFAVFAGLRAPPSGESLREFVKRQLTAEGIDAQQIYLTQHTAEAGRVSAAVEFHGTQRAGTGYVGDRDAPGAATIDLAEWQRLKEWLGGRNRARVLALAHLDAAAVDIVNTTLVREVTVESAPINGAVQVLAERGVLTWRYAIKSVTHQLASGGDRPRSLSAFSGRVLVVGARHADEVAALARQLATLRDRLAAAVAALRAEKQAEWRELLQPQALFAGTAVAKSFQKTETVRLGLELSEVRGDETPPRLTALLRNDGGGVEPRVFSGEVAFKAASDGFQLKLTAPQHNLDDGREPGPFLQDHYEGFELATPDENSRATLRLAIEGRALVGVDSGFTLRFEPVPAAGREKFLAELAGERPALLAATRAGALYTGTITNRLTGAKENFLLQFTKQEHEHNLAAVLEHPERDAWKCGFSGVLNFNRYGNKGRPIELSKLFSLEPPPPAEMLRCFETDDQTALFHLHLEGARLVGENSRFVFRFEPAGAELAAAHAARRGP